MIEGKEEEVGGMLLRAFEHRPDMQIGADTERLSGGKVGVTIEEGGRQKRALWRLTLRASFDKIPPEMS